MNLEAEFRIVHIITGLRTGGTETMLYNILSRMDKSRFETWVVSLTGEGDWAERLRMTGAHVIVLNMRKGPGIFGKIVKLVRIIRQVKPHLVQTWLYHADLIGGLAAKAAGSSKIVWSIRHMNLEPHLNKRTTLMAAKLCSWLSFWVPVKILSNAEVSSETHVRYGYDKTKILTIPNGFDTEVYKPDTPARQDVRQELGIGAEAQVIGLIARFHPQKDHANFIRAAGMVLKSRPETIFILCGSGIDNENVGLASWIDAAGIRPNLRMLGMRMDVPRIMASLDLLVLSSLGEGFPNVIGEAMACGIPCVSTRVGDAAMIIGGHGKVVQPGDSPALAEAILEILALEGEVRRNLGQMGRASIESSYSLNGISKKFENLYLKLIEEP